MKDVNLKLPEKGFALIDCESGKILDVVLPPKEKNGKANNHPRFLFAKGTRKSWRHIILKKDEFVCSLTSLKDVMQLVFNEDSNSLFH